MRQRPVILLLLLLCALAGLASAAPRRRKLLQGSESYAIKYWPSLKWRVETGMAAGCAPVAADVDLDGEAEVFVPTADKSLLCLSPAGAVRWKADVGATLTGGIVLGDVDRDGSLDLCVAAGSQVACFTCDGKPKWTFAAGDKVLSTPVLADLDGDDVPEILFGANDNKLYCLNNGKPKWEVETKSWIVGSPAVADLNGDGKLEVCIGSLDANFLCLNAAGKELWRFETGGWIQTSPAIGDADRDGSQDICFASDDGFVYCLSAEGKLKWKSAFGGGGGNLHNTGGLALADLDGDGTLETIFGTGDGRVLCFTPLGEVAWQGSCGGAVTGSPIIADVNHDSYQEVLVSSTDGRVHCFSTWGSQRWAAYLGSPVGGTPLLADLDRDGKHELYVGGARTADNPKGCFCKFVVTTPGGEIRWATAKGDPCRTGQAGNSVDYGRKLADGNDTTTAWEPFQMAARPERKLLPPRVVQVIPAAPVDDRASGNGNGVLDAGESALLRVRVRNRGTAPVYDTLLTLDAGKSRVAADRTRAFLGRLPGGATKLVSFHLSAPEDIRETSAKLTLRALEGNVNAAFATVSVGVAPAVVPYLRSCKVRVVDAPGKLSRGNGNGRLDAGEQAILWLLVQNDGRVTAKRARARLLSETADVLPATPLALLGDVVPGGGRQLRFAVRVARKLEGRQARLVLQTNSEGGVTRQERITLPLAGAPPHLTPPEITFASPRGRAAATFADTIVLKARITDTAGVSAVLLNGKAVAPEALQSLPGRQGYLLSARRALALGENILAITATDTAGNASTVSINVVRRPK